MNVCLSSNAIIFVTFFVTFIFKYFVFKSKEYYQYPLSPPPWKISGAMKDWKSFYVVEENPCLPWSSTGLISIKGKGRLGNHMGEYASVLSLAKMKGLTPIINRAMRQYMRVFPHLSVKVLNIEELNQECATSFKNMNAIQAESNNQTKFITLTGYPNEVKWFHMVEDQLRNAEFVFPKAIIKDVNDYMGFILHNLSKIHTPTESEVVFIGVHVRRTDYAKRFKRIYKTDLSVGPSFFTRAASLMRDLVDKRSTHMEMNNHHLAFVFVSDDSRWCKNHFRDLPEKISAKGSQSLFSVHFSTDYHFHVRYSPVHFDLAVLSACNNSIFDYGTFGFWGAYLANGITIYADFQPNNTTAETKIKFNLNNWYPLKT